MSTAASSSASPSVVRSHSTSSHAPSQRPPPSDLPHRTRSVALRPATAAHPSSQPQYQPQGHHSHSKSQSYDRRPPSNQAVFDHLSRRDFEASRAAQPVSTRREGSDRSQERSSAAHRADPSSNQKPRRNLAVQGHQRDSIDMAAAGPVAGDGAAHSQSSSASRLAPAATMQSKRRTTISTPSGQWALGKTLGAGSMGKVKVGKNLETGEQVS